MSDTFHTDAPHPIVFFVSNRTGLTAKTFGKNLLAQFPETDFEMVTLSFVVNETRAQSARQKIDQARQQSGINPIVFSTLVNPSTRQILNECDATVFDLFNTFLSPLEKTLKIKSAHNRKGSKKILQNKNYLTLLDAIEYAMNHDDGVRTDRYDEADLILVGVSRSGKTPTSIYLAMNFSLKVSNYPLVENDLLSDELPHALVPHRHKLFGLTIKPAPLSKIRKKRRPNSDYAALENCQREADIAQRMFKKATIPTFDSSDTSIEEIASYVVKTLVAPTDHND